MLRTTPDPSNWSEYPNIWEEVQSLIRGSEWFKVYDFVEALQANFAQRGDNSFADAVNEFFADEGIGWQLIDGQIITRGPEAFETIVTEATAALETSKRPTAAGHLHEALQGLSRRPEPDLSGAAYHAMGALEGVARDLTGDPKATLGEILNVTPACSRSRWTLPSRRFGGTPPMKHGMSWRAKT
jgi:AbiJ-like protein